MIGRLAGLGILLLAAAAAAHIPSPGRILEAVAEANVRSERTRGLRLEVELRDEEGSVEASGRLWLDPSGVARLRLREPGGDVEEHELVADVYRAQRNGRSISSPRPLLPPPQIFQAESGAELRGALFRLGADPDYVELGYEGPHDCFVLGGRSRDPGASERGALWVDVETLDPVRIDQANGVRFRFGPAVEAGRIRFPAWIGVRTARAGWRLEVRSVARGGLPAVAPGAGQTR